MRRIWLLALALVLLPLFAAPTEARDWYVSRARGKGKKGTQEKPAKDLGNIVKKLKPGDVIRIAGGTYLGRGKTGADVILVPVTILGGFSEDFATRDPWGKHKTILSGDNLSKNWVNNPRLMIDLMKYRERDNAPIVVDGLIVDDAGRNRYAAGKQQMIVRLADPKTGKNPTPGFGGIVVRASRCLGGPWSITVQNCIVLNSAPTQGAMSVSGHQSSKIRIRNNIVINNTGTGIILGTKFRPRDGKNVPSFVVENNTVLFTWKYSPSSQSFSGNSIKVDPDTVSVLRHNVLGFADKYGIHNAAKGNITLIENVIVGNIAADYLEFDTKMALEDIEDEADLLGDDTEGNVQIKLPVPVGQEWLQLWGGRVLIDRNAAEADIKAQKSAVNDIRSMLGLPLQAGTVKGQESPVWLHRMTIDDAIAAGSKKYGGKYGSSMPQVNK